MVFKTDYRLKQVKSIAEHSAMFSTFIKLPFAIKIFVLSNFEWPFYTGFTVIITQNQTTQKGKACANKIVPDHYALDWFSPLH